ncbi:MAG: PKD domain-containing protein [Myxococcota bacterium]
MTRLLVLAGLAACAGGKDVDTAAPGDTAAPEEAALTAATARVAVEVGAPATLTVDATGGEVTWSFGDGGADAGESVTHTWAEAGNYIAIASLTAADGRRLSVTLGVEVYRTPAAVPPTWSATVAVGATGRVLAVTPEADTLASVADGHAVVVATCDTPRTLAVDGGVVAVACDDGTLVLYDEVTLHERARVDLGATHPYGVAGRDGTWWVTLSGTGEVAVVSDTVTLHAVGADPRGIALGPPDTGGAPPVYVSRFRSAPDAGAVYRLDGDPIALPVHPGPDSDTLAGGVPTLVQQLALSPDGRTLYVPAVQANVARGLLGTGEPLTFESTVRAALGVVDVDAAAEDWEVRKQLDNQDRVVAVAPSPTGNYLAVAHPGTRTVQLLDAFTLDAVGSIHDAGAGIAGLAWDGDTLYVHAWLDRVVRAYTVGAPGTLPTLAWEASVVEEEPLAAEVLAGKKLFYASGDPRIAKDGYIACASCHPDGDHDGLTWDFTSRGEGMRNTTSLLGRGGTGMGFLHWSANFDEVQDFENDIRNAFGGTGLLSDADWAETFDTLGPAKAGRSADLDALAAYVTSLDTTPASPWEADATEAGGALFVASGCNTCHPAPLYTDSALGAPRLHDVGTLTGASGQRLGGPLDGLDTPTLLGAWSTAPYLHDGSAPTLADAIRAHTTLALDEPTIEALAAWVRGL